MTRIEALHAMVSGHVVSRQGIKCCILPSARGNRLRVIRPYVSGYDVDKASDVSAA